MRIDQALDFLHASNAAQFESPVIPHLILLFSVLDGDRPF